MTTAILDNDPVIVFNNRQLMGTRFDVDVPEERYTVPLGQSRILREGTDITLLGIGYTTYVCQQAAQELEAQGYSAEVLDLLSLSPMDEEGILESVRKTRKIIIVDEDYPRCSIAAEHIMHLGCVVRDLVGAHAKEAHVHEVYDGTKTGRRRAYARANESRFVRHWRATRLSS